MQVCSCTGYYPPSFQKDKVTSYNLQLLYATYVVAAGRTPSYLQPLCGCTQSNSAFPLNVLCRTDRQTDSKINMTLRTVGLAQADVGSRKSDTKLEKTKKVFKNPSGKEEKHMSTNGRSL